MPPEQALPQIDYLDQRADVFGLGAILCEILTGKPPYTGRDVQELHLKAVRAELTDAFERLDGCGADAQLTGLARRALAASRDDRPADAGVLAAELTAYLEGVETRLRQAELAEVQAETRAIEERRRRKQTLALSGAMLAVLAIGVIGTSWGLIRAGRGLEAERQARETVRRELYVADLKLASQIWESENGTAKNVDALLSGHIPRDGQVDLREFAWRLQWTALHRNSLILKGHDGGARLVAFAPGGQLVTLAGDLTLRRWELPAAESLGSEVLRDAAQVSCWAISADARWIALGATDTVHVFDTLTGEKISARTGGALVLALCFSADGRKLAAVWGDGAAQVWEVASPEQSTSWTLRETERVHNLERLALTPDGRNLLLADYPMNRRITWLGADQTEVSVNLGNESSVFSMALTSDGQFAATGDSNGQVCLWDAATLQPIGAGLKIHRGDVRALQFSADGSRLATGGADGIVTVWDVTRREQVHSFKGHRGRIHGLSFSPDGQSLASASEDGDVRVWNLVPSRHSRVIGVHKLPVFGVAWSPDRQQLAVGTGSESIDSTSTDAIVAIRELASGKLMRELRAGTGRVLGLAFSADGRTLATGCYDSYLRLWDANSGHLLRELKGVPSDLTHYSRKAIGTLAISPDGTMIAAGFGSPSLHQSDYKQVAKVWDLASGRELVQLDGHVNTICSVAFSPDGKMLATASDDQQVKLWLVSGWKMIRPLTGAERFKSVVFSRDGQWVVAGGETGTITIWETATGCQVRQLTGHANAVQHLEFSPDGRTLASAGWDNTVKLWDPISGRETRTLRDHVNWISCVAFASDGNTLATGSFDATVRLWEAASAQEIAATSAADRALTERLQNLHRVRHEQRAAGVTKPVAAALLDRYAGHYDSLTVRREDDHLTIHPIHGARGATVPLFPRSENEFVCPDREINITFLTNNNGQVTRVIVYQSGEAFEARKQSVSEQLHPTQDTP
jgi:WD40 repeat protein